MQDIAGLTVIGKTGSGSGDPAEITAATSGHVLRYDGTNVAFGTLASGAFSASTDVPLTALADQAALSVVANGTGTSAAPTAIAAATDGHVLRRVSSTSLAFGTISNANIDTNAGIALSKLATIGANTVLGQTASGAPIALTSGSAGTAKTALGLGNAAFEANSAFTSATVTVAASQALQNGQNTVDCTTLVIGQRTILPFTINSGIGASLVLSITSGERAVIVGGFRTGGNVTFTCPLQYVGGATAALAGSISPGGVNGSFEILVIRIS